MSPNCAGSFARSHKRPETSKWEERPPFKSFPFESQVRSRLVGCEETRCERELVQTRGKERLFNSGEGEYKARV